MIFGNDSCGKRLENTLSSAEIYKESCRACRIFGNTNLKGRISFNDAYPIDAVKTEIRHGVAISRLTHAVAQGPFDMEVMITGSFRSKIHVDNFELWQLGLLALAFQGLNEGLVRVGFGKNRGFGEVETKIESIEFAFSKSLPPRELGGSACLSMILSGRDTDLLTMIKSTLRQRPITLWRKCSTREESTRAKIGWLYLRLL